MDELVAFLGARLDEDEVAARAATPGPWTDTGQRDVLVEQLATSAGTPAEDLHLIAEMELCPDHEDRRRADAEHIARHDPACVLRDVEAGRRILARHVHVPSTTPWTGPDGTDFGCRECGYEDGYGTIAPTGWCGDLRDLLYRWADHPDYRQEWRPTSAPEAPAEAT